MRDVTITLKNVDFKLLAKQKVELVTVINNGTAEGITKKQENALQGILHLIDHIQDQAVNEAGLPEDEVFILSKE